MIFLDSKSFIILILLFIPQEVSKYSLKKSKSRIDPFAAYMFKSPMTLTVLI